MTQLVELKEVCLSFDGRSVLDYSDAKAKEEVQAVVQELKEAKWL